MKKISICTSNLLWVIVLSLAGSAFAGFEDQQSFDIVNEIQYQLILNQNPDGSFGEREEEKIRTTAMAVLGWKVYGLEYGLVVQRALNFLSKSEPQSVDSIARALKALWANKMDAPHLLDRLLTMGYPAGDRGEDVAFYWGGTSRETASIMDTCLILDAFTEKDKFESTQSSAPSNTGKLSKVIFSELIETLVSRRVQNPSDPEDYLGWAYQNRSHNDKHVDFLPSVCSAMALRAVANDSSYLYLRGVTSDALDLGQWTDDELTEPMRLAYSAYVAQAVFSQNPISNYKQQKLYDVFVASSNKPSLLTYAFALNTLLVYPHRVSDSDGDGLSYDIEQRLGFDSSVPDDDWIEKDDVNLSESDRYFHVGGVIDFEIVGSGIQFKLLTELPDGLSLEGNRLIGAAAGTHSIAIQITNSDGSTTIKNIFLENMVPNDDEDGDGLINITEVACSDPFVNDAHEDSDGDGVINSDEVGYLTSHCAADTEDDGLPDGWEIQYDTNPIVDDAVCSSPCTQPSCACDLDADGLDNLAEYNNQSDPRNSDTDGDHFSDKEEVDKQRLPNHNENIDLMIFLNLL